MPTATNDEVLAELFKHMADDERAILCSVIGDPSTADPTSWGGTPWARGRACPLRAERNNYVAISSFKVSAEDGRYRRRKDQYGATHAVMVDDIGTKLPLTALPTSLIPSLVVETSPGNFQATYFLDRPQTDRDKAEAAIKQIIGVLTEGGVDPGMAGVTRVLRLPEGINGKPKYGGWTCKVVVWRPDIRTTWEELSRAFALVDRTRTFIEPDDAVTRARRHGFEIVKAGLRQLGLIKRGSGDRWLDITCPWLADHTDRADTGTAVSPPMKANGYYGGFKCHHGHCESKGWGDLEEWVGAAIVRNGSRTRGDFE